MVQSPPATTTAQPDNLRRIRTAERFSLWRRGQNLAWGLVEGFHVLCCYHNGAELPDTDLVYLAFRFAFDSTLAELEMLRDLSEDLENDLEDDVGFLTEVPFLNAIPLPIQIDLLAEVWARLISPERHVAFLLDAAVLYAACETAGRVINEMPELAEAWLPGGPRQLNPRILKRAPVRLDDLFEEFWDDQDFLTLNDLQDFPPDQAKTVRSTLGLSEEAVAPLYEALARGRVSPELERNLAGLLTPEEIVDIRLRISAPRLTAQADSDDESGFVYGFEDRYNGLLVGPCEETTAEAEAACPFVLAFSMSGTDQFDCSYEDWGQHFREGVQLAAKKNNGMLPVPEMEALTDSELADRVRLFQTDGLDDGVTVTFRPDGWVIRDDEGCFLSKSEEPIWVEGDDDENDDDERYQIAVYDSPEAAYQAFMRSEAVQESIAIWRIEALKKLRRE